MIAHVAVVDIGQAAGDALIDEDLALDRRQPRRPAHELEQAAAQLIADAPDLVGRIEHRAAHIAGLRCERALPAEPEQLRVV